MRHDGHANKFVNDGRLGVFGTPVQRADHAVATALGIERLACERVGDRCRIGIGVNSGPVVEHATRETGDDVLITAATRCLLRADHGTFEEREAVRLRGKSETVRLYAPVTGSAGRGTRDGAAAAHGDADGAAAWLRSGSDRVAADGG